MLSPLKEVLVKQLLIKHLGISVDREAVFLGGQFAPKIYGMFGQIVKVGLSQIKHVDLVKFDTGVRLIKKSLVNVDMIYIKRHIKMIVVANLKSCIDISKVNNSAQVAGMKVMNKEIQEVIAHGAKQVKKEKKGKKSKKIKYILIVNDIPICKVKIKIKDKDLDGDNVDFLLKNDKIASHLGNSAIISVMVNSESKEIRFRVS